MINVNVIDLYGNKTIKLADDIEISIRKESFSNDIRISATKQRTGSYAYLFELYINKEAMTIEQANKLLQSYGVNLTRGDIYGEK